MTGSLLFLIVKMHILSVIFCLLTSVTKFALAISQMNIIIFGGNGFIGSECAMSLLKEGHNLTLVHRGNLYWDYKTRIKPHIQHVKCNRYDGLHNCMNISDANKYDFAIDFSGYHPLVVEDTLSSLEGKIGTYIYLSSDSVYEVCLHSDTKASKEIDAKRPPSKVEQEKLNAEDSYGHWKLACEESLQRVHSISGLPFVIFRLPDVIGPRDTTYRWWTYQTWLQFYNENSQPILIPQIVETIHSSYVYVKDVAEIIRQTVNDISNGNKHLHGNIFNLAFTEQFTLKKMLFSLQSALGVRGAEYRYHKNAIHLYPSVTRGPVNISKAEHSLKWNPTPWKQAVQETVDFYRQALYKFPRERENMMERLSSLMPKKQYQLLVENVQAALGKNNQNPLEYQQHSEL